MSPPVRRIVTPDEIPQSVDVVVVGAGMAGIAAALNLANRGTSVAVIEKGIVSGEQSCRNWGWCRQQNRDPRELPLAQLALQIWRDLNRQTGEETGFRETGLVYASNNAADIATWEKWGRIARDYGVDTRMLSSAEAREKLPGNSRSWLGGVYSPTDGRAEPELAVTALAKAAMAAGAAIVQNCAVRSFETSAGRISGVVTERGLIRCQAVLVAGGAWSGMLLRHHGIKFLQASVKSTAFYTKPAEAVTEGGIFMQDVTLRRRLDGGYTIGLSGQGQLQVTPLGLLQAKAFWRTFQIRRKGLTYSIGKSFLDGPESLTKWRADSVSPFERIRILDPAPDQHLLAKGVNKVQEIYPALKGITVAQSWGGIVDSTPDAIPVISPVQSRPGLFIASGFSGHGFGIGPGAGQLAADLIRGDTPSVDPKPFRYERMIDGTDLGKPGML
jgi:glycine/D-amino acid oxidase-like deaminating enzyme